MFKTTKLYQPLFALFSIALLLFVALPHQAVQAQNPILIVTKTADTADGACDVADCSLREAIIAANAAAGADVITLPAGTYTLSLAGTGEDSSATGDLDIREALTITGAGTTSTIINAAGIDRVIQLITFTGTSYDVTIENLTIQGGTVNAANGGGIQQLGTTTGIVNLTLNNVIIANNQATGISAGGGISVLRNLSAVGTATLTINHSVIRNNEANSGGGINCNGCLLNLNNSTVHGNHARFSTGAGGGIHVANSASVVNIFNSTISGNTSNHNGAGIGKSLGAGTIAINFSTITNNTADADSTGGGATGGGIFTNDANTSIRNSIVQGNTNNAGAATADCNSSTNVSSLGYNVVGSGTGCPSGGTGDTTAAANLGALQVNGSVLTWLQTHKPNAGSAATNRIPNGTSGCTGGTTIDERGAVRADGLNRGDTDCDSGAVEGDSSEQPSAITLQQFRAAQQPASALLFGLLLTALGGMAYLASRKR